MSNKDKYFKCKECGNEFCYMLIKDTIHCPLRFCLGQLELCEEIK